MFLDYFSLFAPWYNSVVKDVSCLLTVKNDRFECSVGENPILSETGDASITVSSDVLTLDSGSSDNKSETWSDFVICVDNNGSIEDERMSSEGALLKVGLVFPNLRFQWSWKIGKHDSLPVSLGIMISASIRGLFLGPGVPVCDGGYRI